MAGLVLFIRSAWRAGVQIGRSLSVLGWTVVALAVVLVLLLATCAQQSAKDAKHARRAAEERALELDRARKADTKASDDRLFDIQVNLNREKERTDAVSTLPDAPSSPVQRRLYCVWLRDQGTRDTDLPADCRSDRRGQAAR
ncbi:hypothetical protein [Brevundimonas sp.]|uniref:hypothetical protein n=1 Tax=Brevundimonas sp. TaxID=1871086 RepID=UPI00289E91C7|nr:hypothetical protein [Brevundimonas sp.]